MIRVLHLVGSDPLVSTSMGVEILSHRTAQLRSAVFRIGRGGDFRSALSAAATLRFSPVPFDLIHAWDRDSFLAAIGSGGPVVYTVDSPLSTGESSWLAASAAPNIRLVASSTWTATELELSGVPAAHIETVLPAAILSSEVTTASSRSALRAELGLTESDFVVFAPGESVRAANHAEALHAVSILHTLNPRFRLLLWGRGPMTRGLAELARRLGHENAVVFTDRDAVSRFALPELATAADVALLTATEPAPSLPIIASAMAGLPVVGFDSRLSRELFPGNIALKVLPPKPRVLARAVLLLAEDPARLQQLADAGRAHAVNQYGPAPFRAAYTSIYQELLSDTAIATRGRDAV